MLNASIFKAAGDNLYELSNFFQRPLGGGLETLRPVFGIFY